MKTLQTITESLEAMGFSLVSSDPTPNVTEDGWPNIKYEVALFFKGKELIHMPYSLGVGHVTSGKSHTLKLSDAEETMLQTWKAHPYTKFQQTQLQANLATKLARDQKVKPQLVDVLYSLLSDGSAHFHSLSFEEWAGDCGYSSDSIKAKEIYDKCVEIGRTLKSRLPDETLEKVQELLANF